MKDKYIVYKNIYSFVLVLSLIPTTHLMTSLIIFGVFLRFAYFIVNIYAISWKGMCHQDLEAIQQQAHTIAQTI
jgi:hypothetical protein